MAAARPFRMVEELYKKAGTIWLSLRVADWIEAFAAHPKIGSRKKTTSHQAKSAAWSKDEQAGVDTASDDTRDALDEANRLYEDKFGFIFIVCATGKSPDEMLAHCVSRIANDRAREISIAAEEQR